MDYSVSEGAGSVFNYLQYDSLSGARSCYLDVFRLGRLCFVGYPYDAHMIQAIALLISFLPAPVQVLLLGLLAVLVFIVVFRVIAMVLNAIPFL